MKSHRIRTTPVKPHADANIRRHYAIEKAHWVSHPDADGRRPCFMRFSLDFRLSAAEAVTIHVSADQRFELCCDEQFVGMGPDRADLAHWSFHTYDVQLEPGGHRLVAFVHFLAGEEPQAQVSWKPGFILHSERSSVTLSTGAAAWRVELLDGYETRRFGNLSYHDVGPGYVIDGRKLFAPSAGPVPAQTVLGPLETGIYGLMRPGWRLHPSPLAEQIRTPFASGRVRMVCAGDGSGPLDETPPEVNEPWTRLVTGAGTLTVEPHTTVSALWDLETYVCAFVEARLSDGAGASVRVLIDEACYDVKPGETLSAGRPKGNRNEIRGKRFLGFGDAFVNDGGAGRRYLSPWWRAGRYVLVTVTTAGQALTIEGLRLIETRYPVENHARFSCTDRELEPVLELSVRGIQMCSHETFMDCPFYEQMMYAGDARIQMLCTYVMKPGSALVRRGLELFDWSRWATGFVAERYPSRDFQLSCTFSMIWIMMLRDFAWWRRDSAFVKDRLPGVRALLEQFRAHMGEEPLIRGLPGWSFMDWVPQWSNGHAPDGEFGVSSVNNLLFLNALKAAAQLEESHGDAALARRVRELSKRVAGAVRKEFWSDKRGLFADDLKHERWSEHAQCLAILSDAFPARMARRCFDGMLTAPDLARTTVYFSFYLFEVLQRFGRGDLILDKMESWKELVALGLKTPVEAPGDTRSDCHAWGSHPLFHCHAGIAGIRPGAPGFSTVRIEPLPGHLEFVESAVPHPDGTVSVRIVKQAESWIARVRLPQGVPGVFVWRGEERRIEGRGDEEVVVEGLL